MQKTLQSVGFLLALAGVAGGRLIQASEQALPGVQAGKAVGAGQSS